MKWSIVLCSILSSALFAQDGENFHHYIWANFKQFNNQHDQAKIHFDKTISNNPSIHAYKGYLHHLQATNQWQHIIKLISKLDAAFSNDIEVQMLFAQAYEVAGNQNESDARLIQLNNGHKNHQEITFHAAQMYLRRKEPENALRSIDSFLSCTPEKANNFIFYFLKSQIYVQLGNKTEALKNVTKSLELYPKFDKSWLLLALLEEQSGRMQQAVESYLHFLKETSEPKQTVEQHLAQLVMQHNLSHITLSGDTDHGFVKAKQAFDAQDYNGALNAITDCIAKEPTNSEYKLFKIDVLAQQKQYNQAFACVEKWLVENPTDELWYKTLHLLQRNDKRYTTQAIKLFKKVEQQNSQNQLPILYLTDLYIRTKDRHAPEYLQKASALANDDTVKTKILYQLALHQFDNRQFKELKQTLLSIYELHPNYLPALNMLAYYYASKENNLAHAYMLIEKVVNEEPTNPHYQDTKAFILYKQGNYQQAHTLLTQAIQQYPHDSTITRHLVKTLDKLGNKQEAHDILQQALQNIKNIDNEHKKLVALQQRWNNGRSK